MKRKQVSLIAGVAICALTVLLTVVYALLSDMFVRAEYILPCDIDSYAADAIRIITEKGLMSTETKDESVYFYPKREVTRAELAESLTRLLELPVSSHEKEALGFADEASISERSLPHIRAVIAGGYMMLYDDYTFRPDEKIPREEAANIVGTLLSGAVSSGKSENFTDFGEISSHFGKNAKKTADYGIMIGYPDSTFRPKQNLTREEFALILHRLLQNESLIQRKS